MKSLVFSDAARFIFLRSYRLRRKKKHSIINLDDFRQPNPVIGTGDRKIADKIYAKCLAASAQFTITLRCDWTDACKINALLYLNEKSNEEICVSSRLFYSKDAVLL